MSRRTNSALALCLIVLLLTAESRAAEATKTAPKDETASVEKSTNNTESAKESSDAKSVTKANASRTRPKKASGKNRRPPSDSREGAFIVRRRLPRYFGQLQLDIEQREQAYVVQQQYAKKLTDLQNQLAQLKTAQQRELVGLLRAAQVRKYEELSQRRTSRTATPTQKGQQKKDS